MWRPIRDHRRKAAENRPFPPEWTAILERDVPYCRYLHPEERARLENLIKVFIREKNFEGCGGLEVTDEMKVTIAAQACLLLLNLHHDYFKRLVSILVYPEGFTLEQEEQGLALGTVARTKMPVMGISSETGVVALSWPDAIHGAQDPGDGINVVFHEFAHQLDQLSGAMDGAPPLESRAMYRDWAQVLGSEYARLQKQVARGRRSVISAYGATRPAEFFAVVTELFFEKPVRLKREHPELYEEFRQYYHQDPAARLEEERNSEL